MSNGDARAPSVVMVFGATGGIGSELSRLLAARGTRLALVARGADRLDTLARELDAIAVPADATRSEQVDASFRRAIDALGRVDAVASCVGSLLIKPAHRTSDAEWLEALAVNLTSSFFIVRAAARAMLTTGGAIALVASAAACVGLASHEAIAAAKAGVIGLMRSAEATYASHGIRVNCVAPGLVRTPLTELLTHGRNLEASLRMHPLGRLGEPGDIAAALAFLLAPENAWITGQALGIDGGLATLRGRPEV